ncbi:hypothetical protein INT45_003739 [Circinella minor]|uniref:CAP-Gly domain-containing protein n=1 Tax=Circinella minor TaxID=1195481 RepID=A0A8H7S8B6_9FUNG|nr:hypothetical protein INT45_003739 [Circinella minor]
MTTLFVLQSNINNKNNSTNQQAPSSSSATTTTTTIERSTGYMNSNNDRRSSSSRAASFSSTTDCSSSSSLDKNSINSSYNYYISSTNTSVNNEHNGPKPQSSNVHLAIGTRVIVPSLCVIGTLRFLGEAKFKSGIWAGIELDLEGAGKNDGCVQGTRYFQCPKHTGLFVLASKVTPMPSGMEKFNEDKDNEERQNKESTTIIKTKKQSQTRSGRSCASSDCCSNRTPSNHFNTTANNHHTAHYTEPTTTKTMASTTPCSGKSNDSNGIEPRITKSSRMRKKSIVPTTSKSTVGVRHINIGANDKSRFFKSTLRRGSDTTLSNSDRKSVVPQQVKSRSTVTSCTTSTMPSSKSALKKSTVPNMKKSRSTITRSELRENNTIYTSTIKSAVPHTNTTPCRRSTIVPRQTKSKSTVTSRDIYKSTILQRPTTPQYSNDMLPITTTILSKSPLISSPSPRSTSRSNTTRRTKHTVNKTKEDCERLRQLLEESRREHEKLTQKLTGKETAWERVLSSKESYALQVKECQQEIKQHQMTIEKLEQERRKWLASRNTSMDDQLKIEQQQQRIIRLDKLVQQLQHQHTEIQQNHDEQTQHHAAEMVQLRRALAERDSIAATMERDCESLQKAGMDAIQMYEQSIQELKQEHEQKLNEKERKVMQLSEAVAYQKTQLLSPHLSTEEYNYAQHQHHIAVATDQRRRLEEQLQLATSELERERNEKKETIIKLNHLADQITKLHQNACSTDKQFDALRQELDNEIKDKRRVMDEANILQQRLNKLHDEHDEITLANNKLEHELAESKRKVLGLDKKLTTVDQSLRNNSSIKKQYVELDQQEGDGKDYNNNNNIDSGSDHQLITDRLQEQYRQLEAENQQLQNRVKELESSSNCHYLSNNNNKSINSNQRASPSPMSPLSPVSMGSFSSLMNRSQHEDQTSYCEICEVYGHEVMTCTAYLTTEPTSLDDDGDNNIMEYYENQIYCLNCDVFGTHQTEDCPNSDEMF